MRSKVRERTRKLDMFGRGSQHYSLSLDAVGKLQSIAGNRRFGSLDCGFFSKNSVKKGRCRRFHPW